MEDGLNPCPFCGSENIYQEYTHILCPDCGCIGPDKHVEGECVDPYVVWNRRQHDPVLLDALKEVVNTFRITMNAIGNEPDCHASYDKWLEIIKDAEQGV